MNCEGELPVIVSISPEQLAAEALEIYAKVQILEAQCRKIINDCATERARSFNQVYGVLIETHKHLLHEQYDFLLASQHESADTSLRQWGLELDIPAKMWEHAIR